MLGIWISKQEFIVIMPGIPFLPGAADHCSGEEQRSGFRESSNLSVGYLYM